MRRLPTLGAVVRYVDIGWMGKIIERPAIITDPHPEDCTDPMGVHLVSFGSAGAAGSSQGATEFMYVAYDPDGKLPRTWHWTDENEDDA